MDFFAAFFLFLTKQEVVIPLAILGILGYDKPSVTRSLWLGMVAMILSPLLKHLFQGVLPSTGFFAALDFPSGHTLFLACLLGWFVYERPRPGHIALMVIVLAGKAWAMIHKGYHIPMDIMGGLLGALILSFFYGLLTHKIPKPSHPKLGMALGFLGLFVPFFLPKTLPHIWLAMGILVGSGLGWHFYGRFDPHQWRFKRRFKIATALIGSILITVVFEGLPDSLPASSMMLSKGFFLGFWVLFGSEYMVFKVRRLQKRL